MIVGFQRAAFSNEAGVGSASIAHAAVKTRFPASEGIVASIGPFIDTVVICTMTALVIIITNIKSNLFDYANLDAGKNVIMNATGEHLGGVDLTSVAFDSAMSPRSVAVPCAHTYPIASGLRSAFCNANSITRCIVAGEGCVT